ncbi:MAG: DUF371 domain-containing protein [Promethearchaeota archaeon]|nr:MAG: DUF371 domain-containing protein [Candidatus Lokiarchaeota archaeon]
MSILDKIYAKGHKNVLCTHNTTIELTKEDSLSLKGNCILGIEATKACRDLNKKLKDYLMKGKKIEVLIKLQGVSDKFYGFGHKNLILSNQKDLVFRKSNYICDRTVLINCSKSSSELARNLIKKIRDSKCEFLIIFKKCEFDETKK